MTEIGTRARKIMHAVVSEYLSTGDAVGSETVTRRYGLEVSAATVRNVMAELEDIGLLRHTHTSAGRIPTERGLRYYVDALLRVRSLSADEKDEIRGRIGPGGDVPDVMQRTTKLLRELSHLAVVVQAPRYDAEVIDHLEFVRLRDGQLLAVIAARSGQIQNKLVPDDFPLSASDLERINNVLDELVSGRTLDDVRTRLQTEIESERARADQSLTRALHLAARSLPLVSSSAVDVVVEGQANLLGGGDDVDRTKAILRALDEKERLVRLLDRTLGAPGICVFIGAEANIADLSDVSVVAASFGGGDRPFGTIGVIGPARMNYSKVIPLVDFTAEAIAETLPKR